MTDDPPFIDDVEDEWDRTLRKLDERVVAANESGDQREIADSHLAFAEHVLGVADPDDIIELLLTARDAYEDFDPQTATRCLLDVGAVAQAAGDYRTAAQAFQVGYEEWAELGEDGLAVQCLNNFGCMAMQLGDYDDAEQAFTSAIAAYLELSQPEDIAEVRLNLANVYRLTGRRDRARTEFAELRREFPENSPQGAACVGSLAALYTEGGQPWLAVPEFEKAIEICRFLGDEEKVEEARMGLGMALLAAGDRRRGEGLVASARQAFVDAERPDKVAACDCNLANFLSLRGDYDAADTAFASAAEGLAAAGMHHQIANLQWNRVKRLVTEATTNPHRRAALSAEAVDTAVAALIAADYERFQFADSGRRAAWTEMLGHRLTWTFLMVCKFGSKTLMADLIESALNAGVYGAESAADEYVPIDPDPVQRTPGPGDDEESTALTMGAATLLATALLPLAPPPALVDGDGRVLLGRQRAMAAGLDPALGRVLETAPRVRIW